MPKPSKQIIIDTIIKEIEKGTTRGRIVSKFVTKCQVTSRTVDRWWKTANQQHAVRQQAIKKELAEVDKEAAINARKKAIMTADERKQYLTKIINGDLKIKRPFVISGKIMEYPSESDTSDRIRAISELNKMEGDYAPDKIANVKTDGTDIVVAAPQKLDNNQFLLLVNLLNGKTSPDKGQ